MPATGSGGAPGLADLLQIGAVCGVLIGLGVFLGYLLDRWLGTSPLLLIVLALLAVAGMSVKLYYGYAVAMDEQSKGRPWAKAASRKEGE